MIEIKNLKMYKPSAIWQVKIDRSSVLGNPFVMKNQTIKERQRVCQEYKDYFNIQCVENIPFKNELHKLIQIYQMYKRLELFCWCAPKQCHGETIRDYIQEWMASNEKFAEDCMQVLKGKY